MIPETECLTTVHDAVQEAKTEMQLPIGNQERMRGPMVTFTFRAHENDLDEARLVCTGNGITLSEYLRKCVELLPRDYKP